MNAPSIIKLNLDSSVPSLVDQVRPIVAKRSFQLLHDRERHKLHQQKKLLTDLHE